MDGSGRRARTADRAAARTLALPITGPRPGEIKVDIFAGGGGASLGIEMATGCQVDEAVNHDAAALALHEANHPLTRHHHCDVFEADPRMIAAGRPVGMLWASPDCTYHSKARGGKPIRFKHLKRRSLAWVVKWWTGTVRPRIIFMENVEEVQWWGGLIAKRDKATGRVLKCVDPLLRAEIERAREEEGEEAAEALYHKATVAAPGERVPIEHQLLVPDPAKAAQTFRAFIQQTFLDNGYEVEWRERRACNVGAPTIRKRWYLIARCDGLPIEWGEPSHGAPDSEPVRAGRRKPFRTAAECIDWSIPILSIFATKEEAKAWGRKHGQAAPKRPLATPTMRRIARGVKRYVVDSPKPFLVHLTHQGERRAHPLDEPSPAITGAQRGELGLVAPILGGVGGRAGQSRERPGDEPFHTVTARGDTALVAPVLVDVAHGEVSPDGSVKRRGAGARSVEEPAGTVLGSGNPALVSGFLVPRYGEAPGQEPRCRSVEEPGPVVVPTGNGGSLAAVHLATYHGEKREGDTRGSDAGEPIDTLDTANRHALVASFLAQHNDGFNQGDGRSLGDPAGTATARDSQGIVAASLVKLRGTSSDADPAEPLDTVSAGGTHHALAAAHLTHHYTSNTGGGQGDLSQPLKTLTTGGHHSVVAAHVQRDFGHSVGHGAGEAMGTITAGAGGHAGLVYALLQTYFGTEQDPRITEPIHTLTTKDRHGLVTVLVEGVLRVIADIYMRMLQPHELFACQGFPPTYKIQVRFWDASRRKMRWLTKTEQVRMVGNSVPPQEVEALVRANYVEQRAQEVAA